MKAFLQSKRSFWSCASSDQRQRDRRPSADTLRVQVRRADEQHPSLPTFIGDVMEEAVVDIFCDQVCERRAADQARC
jgi:hypothetical protein